MLLIERDSGRSVYIGRNVVVTVLDRVFGAEVETFGLRVVAKGACAVSRPGTTMSAHLARQERMEQSRMNGNEVTAVECEVERGETVFIGAGMRVVLLGVNGNGAARIGIDAPRHQAVSRDDFTFDEHLQFQKEREESGKAR